MCVCSGVAQIKIPLRKDARYEFFDLIVIPLHRCSGAAESAGWPRSFKNSITPTTSFSSYKLYNLWDRNGAALTYLCPALIQLLRQWLSRREIANQAAKTDSQTSYTLERLTLMLAIYWVSVRGKVAIIGHKTSKKCACSSTPSTWNFSHFLWQRRFHK